MGGSSWSDDHVRDRDLHRARTGTSPFKHDDDIKSGITNQTIHPKMDIKGKIRESRDSIAHPKSKAIAVLFDDTGSMQRVPKILQKKLKPLMGLLLRKGYVEHPQILFGCIGDFSTDVAPLQIGQFESGIEMDDAFEQMFLEGNGGGTNQESYELALYYFANKISMDCFEKRGEKGYLFIIGDEAAYSYVKKDQIEKIVGDKLQHDLRIETIIPSLLEKFHVFFIIPGQTSNFNNPTIKTFWDNLIGAENVRRIPDPDAVCESIAVIIGLMEDATDQIKMITDLKDVGTSVTVVNAVATGINSLANSLVSTKASGLIPSRSKSDTIEEL